MRVLFILNSPPETLTLFHLAEKMVENGSEISFLLIQEGCRCAVNTEVIKGLGFSKAIYVLEDDYRELFDKIVDFVEVVDYDGWVRLLESCDKTVSWI